MSQGSLSPERVASLLLELARALRARRFYPAKHPALRDALERAASVWGDGLPSGQEVHLELKHGTLALARGTPLRGPGIDDIARELWLRGVRRLRIHSDLEAKETLALIDVLTADADVQAAAGGFEQALRAAGVRHITTSEIDFGEHLGRARGAESPQSDAAGTEGPGSAEAAAVPQALELGETSEARQTPPQAQPKEQLADPTVELLRLLADLERCDEVSKYNLLSNRIEAAVDALLRAKSCADAYCAVLAYCRHAMDTEGRPTPIYREARDRLRRLLDHDALLELVIDRACATSGLSSIHATQVLICVGSVAVPTLLRKRSESNAAVCSQTNSIRSSRVNGHSAGGS